MLSPDAYLVLGTLVVVVALFVTEALRPELVALATMVLLMLTGILTVEEGVSGFANPATLTIFALFMLAAGVYQTGVIARLARKLAVVTGASELKILLVIVLVIGPVSAFVNNTAAVAILLPLVMTIAKESNLSASKFLIPLSFVSMLAGTVTLVGTSTNILTSSLVEAELGRGFTMFEFAPIGLVVFATGGLFLLTIAPRLIPERIPGGKQGDEALLREFLTEVRIRPDSPLVGKTLAEHRTRERYRVNVIRILRETQSVAAGSDGAGVVQVRERRGFDLNLADIRLEAGDLLVLRAARDDLARLEDEAKVEILTDVHQEDVAPQGSPAHLVEVVVFPGSALDSGALSESDISTRYRVKVLGVQPHAPHLFERLSTARLNPGDTLLVLATPDALDAMRDDPHLLVGEERPHERFRTRKTPLALGILAGAIGLAALGVYPILVSALAGAILMVLTGVLRSDELWTSVRWDVIFLLAGLIPLGIAIEKTGLAAALGASLAQAAIGLPTLGILMMFYLLSLLLTSAMSNQATVVLLVPIAFSTASLLDANPLPLVLAVMFAASASFLTPVGYQTNLMVYAAGGYHFSDFLRVGAPLSLILLVVTCIAIQAWFPL